MESANLNKEIASCVKAAVRVRPLSKNEEHDLCQTCVDIQRTTNEIILANSTAFTFDHVFLPETIQEDVYRECVYDMIEGCFQGYSASILAYGQTGSGKTFTMGSGIEYNDPSKEGILPRAIMHIFQRCASYECEAESKGIALSKCVVSCQFIEIYNENIYDLFNKENIDFRSQKNSDKHVVFENSNGEIAVTNITTRFVTTAQETLDCLKEGALSRTTASTRMNSVSSRSHAIFTVNLQFERVASSVSTSNSNLREQFRAKIHFVDLAGSESLKRTGATGQRAKEGISINSGLLVLGNVISILGDPMKKGAHVPYRDSKLTRLLQDSLGGNSRTLMIACISPVDRDFSETKSTLNYAQRARNIRNRVKVNQDKHSRQIIQLQMEIERLRALVDKNERLPTVEYDQASNSALNQELERIRSYIYTIQRSINETNTVSQILKQDLEIVRGHRQINDTTFDYDQALNQCLIRSDEIQSRLSRMIDVSNVLRKRSPLSCRRKSRLTRSFSADQPLSVDFSQGPMGSDELQPCIEDIRHEIDRLRREEQLLRESGSAKSNRIGISTIPGSPQEPHEIQEQQKSETIYPLSTNPSSDIIDNPSNIQIIDEQENIVNSDDEDEQAQMPVDDGQTESDVQEEKLVIITTEINAKQKCLEMLESARKRSDLIRQRYEERIKVLSERIQNAEDEKQAAVTKLNSAARDQYNIEELKLARRDYEEKIRRLEIENNELSTLRAQYTVCLKDGEYYKKELAKHTNELKDLRKMKVQLSRELRQEFIRHRQAEQAKAREIATLKRTQMQKDNVIRTLRAQHKQKEMILKRKQEEVHLLRRQMRSARMRKTTKEMTAHFAAIQQGITNAIRRRKLIAGINRDMNTLIENRERASRKRERYCKRLHKTIVLNKIDQEQSEETPSTPIRESITKLDNTIAYLNSEIASCQQVLMAYDDEQQSNELIQGPDPQFIVDCVTDIDELRYLLTKLIEQTIEKGFEADEANELMSYVDLVENILAKKEDVKPAAATYIKKVVTDTCQDDSMDTTPVPEDSPSSKTIILRPLCNSPRLSNYQSEPMCSD
ncbi:unnamed protein product [Rotaria sordida]|uniref:Kinesin motor domain-containing protein n=1 Tax=Rotaria sordida TaxID=392033 RepID=A0A818XDH3_9BILA|nr:unnamed protein product [Rotaria sordida]CAF0949165.1 unnamed protein product [Rotaria sordida]CAF3613255.1 unnamed protein product [Rotaria sordida]CAF3735778.1 unnamed protein product [Rotaria sordida]